MPIARTARAGGASASLVPCGAAFVASACVMTVELLAGRMVARYLGSSLYTWTSIIGVVLGGLAVGNYVGGRLADRYRTGPTLSLLFILSSAGCLVLAVLNRWMGDWSFLWTLTQPQRIAVHVALTFTWPAALLGMIGPVVAKMALDAGRHVGRTVGNVYAWGAIGSIVGTFAAGFFLIPRLSVDPVIYLVAGVLAAAGVFFAVVRWPALAWAGVVALAAVTGAAPWGWARTVGAAAGLRDDPGPNVLFDEDSRYSHVRVEHGPGEPGMRVMLLDSLAHSFIDMGRPDEVIYGYERVYAAVTDYVAGPRDGVHVLILGGGGYTHPRYIVARRPNSRVRVVEIDPVVTRAAMEAFGFTPDPRIEVVHLDGRQHLAELVRRKRAGEAVPAFDFVFLDALHDLNVPYHLTTRECQEQVREAMAPGGVYMMNLIDILDVGRFLGATLNTAGETFGHVACFFANDFNLTLDTQARNTFVVVASDRDLRLDEMAGSPLMEAVRRKMLPADVVADLRRRGGGVVLTDDYAPVENLLAGVVQRAGDDAALNFYARAQRRRDAGEVDGAVTDYRRCIELDPEFFNAQLNLGNVLAARRSSREDLIEAGRCFQAAAALRPDETAPIANLGSVYMLLGDYAAAVDAYRRSVEIDPAFANGHNSLGMALANLGRLEESRRAFLAALQIEPGHAAARENLARVNEALEAASRPATPGP